MTLVMIILIVPHAFIITEFIKNFGRSFRAFKEKFMEGRLKHKNRDIFIQEMH